MRDCAKFTVFPLSDIISPSPKYYQYIFMKGGFLVKTSKFYVCLLVLAVLAVSSSLSEAASPIRLAVMNITKNPGLMQASEIAANTFTGTLAKSGALVLAEREQLDLIIREQEISASELEGSAAKLGGIMGCQYILLSSLTYDSAPIIAARLVEVETSEVVYSDTEIPDALDDSAMAATSSRMADRVLEVLAGEQAVITEINGSEVLINRGSSSGVRIGDLYRVYVGTKRNPVNMGVIRVKGVRAGFSTTGLVKNGGYISALRKSDKVEAVSKQEADSLMKRKNFVKKRPGEKEAANPTLSLLEELCAEPMQEYFKFFERCGESMDAVRQKRHAIMQQDPKTQQITLTTKDAKLLNEIGEGYLGLGIEYMYHSRNNSLYTAYKSLDAIKIGLSFDPKEQAEKDAQREEKLANQCFSLAKLWFEFAAKRGNLDAINNLGVLYMEGLGVEKDYKKAFEYVSQAVADNDPVALDNLGTMYLLGHGVGQDYAKAFELFSKSAEGGNLQGQVDLGIMYNRGLWVKQDYAKAVELYRKAAEKGNASAQTLLGTMYDGGVGVPQDFRMAIKLYRQAAAQGRSGEAARGFLKKLGAN